MDVEQTSEALGFIDMIAVEFAFLVERGFHMIVEGENSVRYENQNGVLVRVLRDPNDKYVGLRVGLANRPRDALTGSELARLGGVASPRGEYPERSNQLHASVARVAKELRTHGERIPSPETKRSLTRQWT
jgi:hypothetical protein